ncbi:MAG: hypothetical protein LJE93_06615 [Acidobacteria bacterium]|nr:hypothetical protein [Acidobacteriota bacterium]
MENEGAANHSGIHRSEDASPTSMRAAFLGVLLLALCVRVLLLTHISLQHPEYIVQDLDSVETNIHAPGVPYMNDFGYEASNIAYAWVAGGQVYASPFGGATGPTAWIAPGIVAPYALSFALWDCFTPASILFAYGLALIVSLLTTVVVFKIAALLTESRRTGLAAALIFAVLPYEAWVFHTRSQLDFNLPVLWFALLLLAVLRTIDEPGSSGIGLGVVSSFAALFNPGFILCTGVGWLLAMPGRGARRNLRLGLNLLVVHVLLVGPYVAWQSFRIGTFVPVKSNAPVELFIGNTDTASGLLRHQVFLTYHPSQNDAQFVLYSEVGEGAYVREARRRFLESFDTREFIENTVRRAYLFFFGYEVKPWDHSAVKILIKRALWLLFFLSLVGLIVIRRGRPSRLETASLLFTLAYAFPYLFTGIMERYRIPITPVVAVALAIMLREVWNTCGRRSASSLL